MCNKPLSLPVFILFMTSMILTTVRSFRQGYTTRGYVLCSASIIAAAAGIYRLISC
ncbi:MAG: hypothetical protein IKK21_06560 [Clostridia bacterium]|nr:hypothetical protein [Clostridia bacterium]